MIRLIREILVLPLWLAVFVCRFVPIWDRYALMKLIWKFGRDKAVGCQLIQMMAENEGVEAAREFARQVLEETRSAEAAMVIGLIEYKGGDAAVLKGWIDLAEDLDCKDRELLLILKIYCSNQYNEYDGRVIIDEMLECNYLPAWMSRYAFVNKGYQCLASKIWDEAESIADLMLSISEDSSARFFKWVVCLQRDDETEAGRHFGMLKGDEGDHFYHTQIGEGYLYLDRKQEAMESFYKAKEAGLDWPEHMGGPIADVLNSSEFKSYCAERD